MKTDKLNQLVNQKVAQQLEEAKTSKKSTKKAAPAAKAETKKLVPVKKASKKAQVVKETEQQQKVDLIEKVIAHREVKYIYPADVQDTLARKKWRQAVRNKIKDLERKMLRLQDGDKKEFAAAKKAYEEYKAQVLKPEQDVA